MRSGQQQIKANAHVACAVWADSVLLLTSTEAFSMYISVILIKPVYDY